MKSWMAAALLLVSIAELAMVSAASAAKNGENRTVILNETSWLRQYYRFGVNRYSAQAMKIEGEKVLGRTGMDRTRRETEKLMAQSGLDVARVDWREHVVQPMFESYRPATAPLPPDDWTSVGFRDSAWVLSRGPFQGSRPAGITNPGLGQFEEASMDLALQQAFYRARFIIEDPSQVGELTFYMTAMEAHVCG